MSPRSMRRTYSPNQVVAYNVGRARALRGWTQEQAASELSRHLEKRMSRASYSAIERSTGGGRVKQFSADELVALARAFRLPVLWFFLPPPLDDDPGLHVPHTGSRGIEFTEFLDVFFGTADTRTPYRDAFREWAAAAMDRGLIQKVDTRLSEQDDVEVRAVVEQSIGDIPNAQATLRRAAELLAEVERIIRHEAGRDSTVRTDREEDGTE